MTYSSRITRFNIHQLPPYERMQQMRARRAAAVEMAQKHASLANGFATIQVNKAARQGDLFSKIAMQRISRKV